MDPFTMMALSSMAPMALNMMMPGQSFPGQSPVNNINFGQLQPYGTQMLQNAFSPQSNLLNIALQKGGAGVDNSMAARGLANSSMADAMRRQMTVDTQNSWLQNETQRQAQAYGGVAQGLGAQAGVASAQNQDAWQRYLQTQKNTGAMSSGIGTALGGIAGAYAGYSANQQNQGNFNTMMNRMYPNSTGYTGPSGPLSTMSVGN